MFCFIILYTKYISIAPTITAIAKPLQPIPQKGTSVADWETISEFFIVAQSKGFFVFLSYTLNTMRRFILICLLTVQYFNTHAQVFGGPGSTWWIEFNGPSSYGKIKFYDLSDTVVNGTTYQFTKVSAYSFTPPNPNEYYTEPSPLIRVSGDSVLLLLNGIEYPQYIFSADSGDTWTCGPVDICNTGNEAPYVKVEAKFDTLINGQMLRAMRLRKYFCEPNFFSSLVIEKFGSRDSHIFPLWWTFVDSSSIEGYDLGFYNLTCFSSNEFPISQQQSEGCDGPLDVKENPLVGVALYPNPGSGVVNITGLYGKYSYALYNAVGDLIQSGNTIGNTLDITYKPAGLYFLKIYSPTYSKSFKLVKN